MMAATSIIVTSMSIGFLQATLEPHMRRFNLSPVVLGLMFVINGGTYAVTAPGWGWLCDSRLHPKVATILGAILVAVGFCLIGPAPFIPHKTWVTLETIGISYFSSIDLNLPKLSIDLVCFILKLFNNQGNISVKTSLKT